MLLFILLIFFKLFDNFKNIILSNFNYIYIFCTIKLSSFFFDLILSQNNECKIFMDGLNFTLY